MITWQGFIRGPIPTPVLLKLTTVMYIKQGCFSHAFISVSNMKLTQVLIYQYNFFLVFFCSWLRAYCLSPKTKWGTKTCYNFFFNVTRQHIAWLMFIALCLSEGLQNEIRIPNRSCCGTMGLDDEIAVRCVLLLIASGKLWLV